MTKIYIVSGIIGVLVIGGAIYYFASASNPSAVPSASAASENVAPAQNNPSPKVRAQTESPSAPATDSATQPGVVSAYVVDQYGNPYPAPGALSYSGGIIFDSLGVKADAASITNGNLKSDTLTPGTYTMEVPGDEPDAGITMFMDITPAEVQFTLPAQGINLGKIVITRWGSVYASFTDAVGTPLIPSQVHLVQCSVSDPWVQKRDALYAQTAIDKAMSDNGSCDAATIVPPGNYNNGGGSSHEVGIFPAGTYTITFSASGYADVSKTFAVENRKLDLGTIVFQQQ